MKEQFFQLKSYVLILAVVWTIIFAVSLAWNMVEIEHNALNSARIQARAAYKKDILYRRWNAGYGGVYVPVTKKTQPNPYLSGIPERDITTPSGRTLTLMNPAYMTRQVHELAKEEYGVLGHITSLNPIRPQNAPDPWEIKALEEFERGPIEVSSVEKIEGKEFMRLMRPLITERGCLKCHAAQGYEEGDIRGGISVSVPMGPLRAIAHKNEVTLVLAHALLWLAGLGGIGLWTLGIRRRESERRQAEQAIRKYDRELAQANVRLQELDKLKSMFIASMSHELRTPLNSIIGFTGIILQGMSGEVTAEQRKQLTMVKTSAAHLLALINDVIDVSKIEAGKVELDIEQFDLAALVQEVKKSFETTADEQGLKITLEVPERLTVKSDERRTKQVIINFVSNAIKFTDEGRIDIKLAKRDDEAEVSVADTGIGIKKEDIGKLFQAFGRITTENRLAEGSGLGLYLSKKIADLLGGEIKAESEFARGSVFTFILPLKHQESKK
jgi:hypothetical protein